MTQEQFDQLQSGDVIEFRGDCAYWLARLVKKKKIRKEDTELFWTAMNNGSTFQAEGHSSFLVAKYCDQLFLVGHSDYEHPKTE